MVVKIKQNLMKICYIVFYEYICSKLTEATEAVLTSILCFCFVEVLRDPDHTFQGKLPGRSPVLSARFLSATLTAAVLDLTSTDYYIYYIERRLSLISLILTL